MSWRALTEADLLTAISPNELDVLRRALGGDASDAISAILTNLANELRGYIAAGGSDLDSTAATVPDSLVAQAAAVAVIRVSNRAGGTLPDPKGLRAKAHDNAIAFFQNSLGKGLFAIEQPTSTTLATLSGVPAKPTYTAKDLKLQRDDQNGL
jgi:hypothetical protein